MAKLVVPAVRIHKHSTQGNISDAKKVIEQYSRMICIFLYLLDDKNRKMAFFGVGFVCR